MTPYTQKGVTEGVTVPQKVSQQNPSRNNERGEKDCVVRGNGLKLAIVHDRAGDNEHTLLRAADAPSASRFFLVRLHPASPHPL